jgi:DNA-binding GntR family transcriptional regulator
MDSFSIEKPVRYYDQVYNSIRESIVQGVLKPGDSLFEARIARELNISRSPVREAVRALEKEGLLVIDEK